VRAVIQRVSSARVRVAGETVGQIGHGLAVLVGFGIEDAATADLEWLAEKLWGLRVFRDEGGKMNRSALETGAELLIISQFTLYGDAMRGRRPSFIRAALPEIAEPLYDRLVELCRRRGPVETGRFGATMELELVNDGPVTLQIER